jgi:plastocyanin
LLWVDDATALARARRDRLVHDASWSTSAYQLEDRMRRRLLGTAALAVLMGCGGSSTGPNANPNPNPQHYTITVNGGTFQPDTQRAVIGDVIYWEVAPADPGQHQVTFFDVPAGVPTPTPTKVLTAGQRDSTIFQKDGTYMYKDELNTGTGVVIIAPLPSR